MNQDVGILKTLYFPYLELNDHNKSAKLYKSNDLLHPIPESIFLLFERI